MINYNTGKEQFEHFLEFLFLINHQEARFIFRRLCKHFRLPEIKLVFDIKEKEMFDGTFWIDDENSISISLPSAKKFRLYILIHEFAHYLDYSIRKGTNHDRKFVRQLERTYYLIESKRYFSKKIRANLKKYFIEWKPENLDHFAKPGDLRVWYFDKKVPKVNYRRVRTFKEALKNIIRIIKSHKKDDKGSRGLGVYVEYLKCYVEFEEDSMIRIQDLNVKQMEDCLL